MSDDASPAISVLLVCMGNICRSPMAEGVLRQRLAERSTLRDVHVDSAGTHSYHAGAAPDRRAQTAAARRGIDISGLRARRVTATDFEIFDYILAMDESNFRDIMALNPGNGRAKVHLLLDFAHSSTEAEVPDPYYGGNNGFEYVLDLVDEASTGLLDHICTHYEL